MAERISWTLVLLSLGGPIRSVRVLEYNMLAIRVSNLAYPWITEVPKSVLDEKGVSYENYEQTIKKLNEEYETNWNNRQPLADDDSGRWFYLWPEMGIDLRDNETFIKDIWKASGLPVTVNETSVVIDGKPSLSFRGVFEAYIENGKGREIFNWLLHQQKNVMDWQFRGPKLFKRVLEYDPDIVVMPEYDGFSRRNTAEFRTGITERFEEAMLSRGYHYQLIPIQRDGVGVFFRVAAEENKDAGEHTQKPTPPAIFSFITLSTMSLEETSHPSGCTDDSCVKSIGNRKTKAVGNVRLKWHYQGSEEYRTMNVVGVHLLTQSGDKGEFPGEVRAGELASVKKYIASGELGPIEATDDIVFAGDFNTNARGSQPYSTITLPGGALKTKPDAERNSEKIFMGEAAPTHVDTGYDIVGGVRMFRWNAPEARGGGEIELADTYADDWNERRFGQVPVCTSHNAQRIETIDFIFASRNLQVWSKSVPTCPDKPIPNDDEPSDHMPIVVDLSPTAPAPAATPLQLQAEVSAWPPSAYVAVVILGVLCTVSSGSALVLYLRLEDNSSRVFPLSHDAWMNAASFHRAGSPSRGRPSMKADEENAVTEMARRTTLIDPNVPTAGVSMASMS